MLRIGGAYAPAVADPAPRSSVPTPLYSAAIFYAAVFPLFGLVRSLCCWSASLYCPLHLVVAALCLFVPVVLARLPGPWPLSFMFIIVTKFGFGKSSGSVRVRELLRTLFTYT